jgi:hypothetical protein
VVVGVVKVGTGVRVRHSFSSTVTFESITRPFILIILPNTTFPRVDRFCRICGFKKSCGEPVPPLYEDREHL